MESLSRQYIGIKEGTPGDIATNKGIIFTRDSNGTYSSFTHNLKRAVNITEDEIRSDLKNGFLEPFGDNNSDEVVIYKGIGFKLTNEKPNNLLNL